MFSLVCVIKTPMLQLLKGHYQGVRTVTYTCTYMHMYSISVHIECEAIYDNTGVRGVNFMLSSVQVLKCIHIHILWPKVCCLCFHGYVNLQVCLLDMLVFIYLGVRNCYIYMCLPYMQPRLGITFSPAP